MDNTNIFENNNLQKLDWKECINQPNHHRRKRRRPDNNTSRPQPFLRHVQTAVHEALVECQNEGRALAYDDLKQRAKQIWEKKFSDKLAQWGFIHNLPLSEPVNRRKLPPFAQRLVEDSTNAFDTDHWCQALLLSHDSKVLFVVETVQERLQHSPELTFFELTQHVIGVITGYLQSQGISVEPDHDMCHIHFKKEVAVADTTNSDTSEDGWIKVKGKHRPQVETMELSFPSMAWFYAYKIFAFPYWMNLSRTDFHEATHWRNLSNSEKHHNRILDHVRSVIQVQQELLQLQLQQQQVDYTQPLTTE